MGATFFINDDGYPRAIFEIHIFGWSTDGLSATSQEEESEGWNLHRLCSPVFVDVCKAGRLRT